MKEPICPAEVLTVIIRDDGPMMANDSPTFRSVQIKLTPEQIKLLALRHTWTSGGVPYYEQISKCFIEPSIL